jgi:proline dehydrogenase
MRIGEGLLGPKLFSLLMKSTFYGQFVAGETGPAVTAAAEKLRDIGLTLMVAPALESDLGEGSSAGYVI